MRVLICGVIGAAAAAAVWLGLEHYLRMDLGWLAIVVGLVTGLSVHKGAGAATSGGYVRGALAVVLALVAIVGGRQAYAKIMELANERAANVAPAVAVAPSNDEKDVADVVAPEPVADILPEIETAGKAMGDQKLSIKSRFSEMDTVWMCIGALAAYLVGKGGGTGAAPVQDEESDPDEAPAE